MRLLHERPTYVYLIGSKEFNWYKIGLAVNVERRLAQLLVGLPFPVSALRMVRVRNRDMAIRLEARMHTRYAEHRVQGEWFTDIPVELFVKAANEELQTIPARY